MEFHRYNVCAALKCCQIIAKKSRNKKRDFNENDVYSSQRVESVIGIATVVTLSDEGTKTSFDEKSVKLLG